MNKKLLLIGAVLAIGVLAFGYIKFKSEPVVVAETTAPSYLADRILGDPNAPITLTEYANFTCSHCGDFHRGVFKEFQKEFIDTGKVKLAYREVITDGPGLLAVSLARCLPENQYFGMVSVLYDKQDQWAYGQTDIGGVKERLQSYASLAGLSKETGEKCFNDTKTQEVMVNHTRKVAADANIQGTPSLYINDKYVKDRSLDGLRKAVAEAAQ